MSRYFRVFLFVLQIYVEKKIYFAKKWRWGGGEGHAPPPPGPLVLMAMQHKIYWFLYKRVYKQSFSSRKNADVSKYYHSLGI